MNPAGLRSVFPVEDDLEYEKALLRFENRVPRFSSKEDAVAFSKLFCRRGSNPDEPHLLHSISTLTTWSQIEKYILPKIKEFDIKWRRLLPQDSAVATNRYISGFSDDDGCLSESNDGGRHVLSYLRSRLDLPIHRFMSPISTMNTFNYLYHHMRSGIFVMIRNNQVVIFCPFVNKGYRNSWGQSYPRVDSADGSLEAYYTEKLQFYRRREAIIPKNEWWANGNIIDNEHTTDQWLGDHFLLQLKVVFCVLINTRLIRYFVLIFSAQDMIVETCSKRYVPDCEFFMNKRDYPHLKFNSDLEGGQPVEPYGFIFDRFATT